MSSFNILGTPTPNKNPKPAGVEVGEREGYMYRHRFDKAIAHVVKNSKPTLISETADFNEWIYQHGNLVALIQTSDYTWMLLQFRSEDDAKKFHDMLIEISEASGRGLESGISPFFLSCQRQFIRTLISYFDDAKILAYARRVSEKFEWVLDKVP